MKFVMKTTLFASLLVAMGASVSAQDSTSNTFLRAHNGDRRSSRQLQSCLPPGSELSCTIFASPTDPCDTCCFFREDDPSMIRDDAAEGYVNRCYSMGNLENEMCYCGDPAQGGGGGRVEESIAPTPTVTSTPTVTTTSAPTVTATPTVTTTTNTPTSTPTIILT